MEKSTVLEATNRMSLTIGASVGSVVGVVATSAEPSWFVLAPIAVPFLFLFGDYRERKKEQSDESKEDSLRPAETDDKVAA